METINFEDLVLDYLKLPSIPVKKHDGKTSFKDGVAVVRMMSGCLGYAVATFDSEKDSKPRIKKTFSLEPFKEIIDIFVVPSYMDTDEGNIIKFDLDEESKAAALKLAEEADELENKGVKSEGVEEMESLPEWVFDNIHNIEEAQAFIRSYNSRNKIKGRIPSNEETIKLRLIAIHEEIKSKNEQQ